MPKYHTCQKCKAKFTRLQDKRNHQCQSPGSKHVCDICGAAFARRNGLENHQLVHQPSKKTYHCMFCKQHYQDPQLLKNHLRAVHPPSQPEEGSVAFRLISQVGVFKAFELKFDSTVLDIGERTDVLRELRRCLWSEINQGKIGFQLTFFTVYCRENTLSYHDLIQIPTRSKMYWTNSQSMNRLERQWSLIVDRIREHTQTMTSLQGSDWQFISYAKIELGLIKIDSLA